MEIFVDSADVKEIRKWLEHGVLDGVTTNPSIMLKDGGYDIEARAREIAELIYPRPISVEVYTNDHEEMMEQALTFVKWAPNIVVKIPVLDEYGTPCLKVVRMLVEEGVKVNMTACLSFGQVALGAKAGATYISIFAGRVADEGCDAPKLIRQAVAWLSDWRYASKIIVGSIRSVIDVQEAALAQTHVVTVPPQFMDKLVDHHYSRATVAQFNQDARIALARMEEARAHATA